MGHIGIAVACGVVAGLVAGGRPGEAGRHRLRWWPVLVAGVAVQVASVLTAIEGSLAFAALVVSYAALLTFAGANLQVTGMPIVLLGITLNLSVMVVNGGMPVRGEALVRAGLVDEVPTVGSVDLGPKRHLETDADRLRPLGDVVAVAPLRQVLSVGDVVLAAGLAAVVFRLLAPARSDRTAPSAPPPAAGRAGPRW